MNDKINESKESIIRIILKVLIFVYPLMFVWQGFDVTDVGYSIVGYQQIFNDPKAISTSFSIWLTNIIGGLWLKIFKNLGLIGIRLGGVIITWLIIYYSYKILNKYINKNRLFMYLFLCLVFTYRTVIIIHYNWLSALFYILGIYLIFRGIIENKKGLILLSGLVSGFNIFIRFPNILQAFIVFSIVYYGIRKKVSFKIQIKHCINYVIGYISAIIISILSMKILGHWNIFINSIRNIMSMGKDASDSHGVKNMILALIKEHINVVKYSSIIMLLFISVFILLYILKKIKVNPWISSLIIGIILFYFMKSYAIKFSFYKLLYIITGFTYILILYNFIINRKNIEYTLVMFFSVFYLLVVPMGSNNGIYNSIYSFWLAIPIAFEALIIMTENLVRKKYISNITTKCFVNFTIVLFCILVLRQNYLYTYRDLKDRKGMKYTIDNKYLSYVYTNKNRANDTGELLNELKHYVNKDDYLLVYSHMPMLHYITETKPYMFNSWPGLFNKKEFQYYLNKAKEEYKIYPVLVNQKINTRNLNWPVYDEKFKDEHKHILSKFIKEGNYSLVWKNKSFEIYIPMNKEVK